MEKEFKKVDAPIIGANGNVYNLIGICREALKSNGYVKEADELLKRVTNSHSYDEALQIMMEYDGKKFKSIAQGDLDLLDKEEKNKIDEIAKDKKSMLDKIKEVLADEVSDVVLSKRLTDSPVCIVSKDGLSLEMEKVLEKMPNGKEVKAEKVLEINPNHKLFEALERLFNDGDESFDDYATLLYSQALLIEGFKLKDPVEFSNKMCELMIKSAKY